MRLLIINGPNLNMLGIREPEIYGNRTYSDLKEYIYACCSELEIECKIVQSNHEGVLIDCIQEAYGCFDGIVINAAGYTHTSIAILDALKAVNIPAVEVHLSDVDSREEFRRVSYVGMACEKRCSGAGFESYKEAIKYLHWRLSGELMS